MRAFLGVSVTDESGANAHRSQPVEEGTEAARYRGCAPLRPQAYVCQPSDDARYSAAGGGACLLGHAQVQVTLRYAHVSDRDVEAGADRIGGVMARIINGSAVRSEPTLRKLPSTIDGMVRFSGPGRAQQRRGTQQHPEQRGAGEGAADGAACKPHWRADGALWAGRRRIHAPGAVQRGGELPGSNPVSGGTVTLAGGRACGVPGGIYTADKQQPLLSTVD